MPASKREQLIETAQRLFHRRGYHATGIDTILEEAGVAKMTLYNHFRSKDDLILAALRRRDEEFRNWFVREVESRGETARERLLAMFDVIGNWCRSKDFSGCAFINATAEFADGEHPVHAAAAEHKRLVLDFIRSLAREAGAKDPAALALQLNLLLEGIIVSAQVRGCGKSARAARDAAELIIDAACG